MVKKVLIFYAVLSPFIMIGSLYNLIEGIILQKTPTYRIGLFSVFGFVIMPLLLIITYLKNKCEISGNGIRIGKIDYPFSDYHFSIREKELAFKDRPLTSLLKKKYQVLVIQAKKTHEIVLEKDLDVFEKDIENIRNALPG